MKLSSLDLQKLIRAVCSKYCHRNDLDDLVQEVNLCLLKKECPTRSYLYKVIRNVASKFNSREKYNELNFEPVAPNDQTGHHCLLDIVPLTVSLSQTDITYFRSRFLARSVKPNYNRDAKLARQLSTIRRKGQNICCGCNKTFAFRTRSTEKYCSTDCRLKTSSRRRSRPLNETRRCTICRKDFEAAQITQSYCSPVCRYEAHKLRQRKT